MRFRHTDPIRLSESTPETQFNMAESTLFVVIVKSNQRGLSAAWEIKWESKKRRSVAMIFRAMPLKIPGVGAGPSTRLVHAERTQLTSLKGIQKKPLNRHLPKLKAVADPFLTAFLTPLSQREAIPVVITNGVSRMR